MVVSDHGTKFTSKPCSAGQASTASRGTSSRRGKPMQNRICESFNGAAYAATFTATADRRSNPDQLRRRRISSQIKLKAVRVLAPYLQTRALLIEERGSPGHACRVGFARWLSVP
jgi:hypothetical protein